MSSQNTPANAVVLQQMAWTARLSAGPPEPAQGCRTVFGNPSLAPSARQTQAQHPT